MRMILALVALLATAMFANAQGTTSYQDEQVEVGQKQILVNEKSQNFQNARITYLDLDKTVQTKADTFNKQVDKAKDEREQWLGRNQIYDNVISLRSKDKVMAAVDEARKKLGVSELEGYQRMGAFNPYSGESYLKYYDPKTGELVIGEVRALYKNLEAARDDFQHTCDRLHGSEGDISKSYQDVLDKYRAARDAKQEKDKAINELAKAQETLNRARAQAEAAEIERQRLQEQQNRQRNRGNYID